jgi:hypothetical protein
LLGRFVGFALPGQEHAQIVVGLAGAGGRLEMLLSLAQAALADKHHTQIVVGQFEIRIQADRARKGFLGLGQIIGHEIGHAQVVVKRRRAGLQLGGQLESNDGFVRLPALIIKNAQGALGAPKSGVQGNSLPQTFKRFFLAALAEIGQAHALVVGGVVRLLLA